MLENKVKKYVNILRKAGWSAYYEGVKITGKHWCSACYSVFIDAYVFPHIKMLAEREFHRYQKLFYEHGEGGPYIETRVHLPFKTGLSYIDAHTLNTGLKACFIDSEIIRLSGKGFTLFMPHYAHLDILNDEVAGFDWLKEQYRVETGSKDGGCFLKAARGRV
jgi:hypothetical protein